MLAACTVDAPDDGLGTLTGPPMPTAGTPTGGGDDGSGDDDGADDGDDGSGSADDDGGPGSGSDTGSASADSGSDGGSAATDGGGGAQPEDGVYSACMTAAECVGATYCIPAGDGFCTRDCKAPAECPPTPGGAAPTVCIAVTAPVATSVCAIDCSGGQPCPAPMTCGSVEGSMVCV